jgi:hypothetical protein
MQHPLAKVKLDICLSHTLCKIYLYVEDRFLEVDPKNSLKNKVLRYVKEHNSQKNPTVLPAKTINIFLLLICDLFA